MDERNEAKRHFSSHLLGVQKEKVEHLSALHGNEWTDKINLTKELSCTHLEQFFDLWVQLKNFQFLEGTDDDISWNLS